MELKAQTKNSQKTNKRPLPRTLAIAERGVNTGRDFAALMSALMSDLIDGSVTPQVGNAICNAGGKLLKVVEMERAAARWRRAFFMATAVAAIMTLAWLSFAAWVAERMSR